MIFYVFVVLHNVINSNLVKHSVQHRGIGQPHANCGARNKLSNV